MNDSTQSAGDTVAILVAAGASTRMRAAGETSGPRKPWLELGGAPLLVRTASAFEATPSIAEIVIVAHPDDLERVRGLRLSKLRHVVPGGATRAASVRAGLAVTSDATPLAAIHDAARPLISVELIERVLHAARTSGAALPALPIVDTLKRVADELALETVPRADLMRAQTPQCFDRVRMLELVTTKPDDGITDDASLWELHVGPVTIVLGDERNFKVTRAEDLELARFYDTTNR